MKWTRARHVRQAVQALALALYVYLLFATLQRRAAFPLADLFFRLDPLVAIGAMLAGRTWIPRLALALVTIILTLLLGRVWCGWLCPMGTLLDWVRLPGATRHAQVLSPRWRSVKYLLLFTILFAALFANLSLMVLDPITLLTRTMTTAVLPALNHAITATERALYNLAPLRPLVDGLEGVLRGRVLPVVQQAFAANFIIVALFVGVVGLNALARRFWCRYLCPLGALLGLISRVAILRPFIGRACTRCGQCAKVCEVDAIESGQDYAIVAAECVVCLDCLAACPRSGATFAWGWRPAAPQPYDPGRRQVLTGVALGAVGASLLRTSAAARQPHPRLIRPPGVRNERAFLAKCVRCSQCMKVCPTTGLQPLLLEAGLEGLWTPRLVPRLGYCDYSCHACGQVCPSGAIPLLTLEAKRSSTLGLAAIDRNRCRPWAYGTPCIVCEEMCPVPEKAIRLQEVEITNEHGDLVRLQQPGVIEELCIGCGICEYQCPMPGQAAIQVYR